MLDTGRWGEFFAYENVERGLSELLRGKLHFLT